jgi:hypothetical protein
MQILCVDRNECLQSWSQYTYWEAGDSQIIYPELNNEHIKMQVVKNNLGIS